MRRREEIVRDSIHAEEKELLHLLLEVILDIRDQLPTYHYAHEP